MENDPAREWQRMQEVYSQMSEDELQEAADEAYGLTEPARQALQMEIKTRGVTITPRLQQPVKHERPEMHSESEFLARELFTVYVAFSSTEAHTVIETLDQADIPWRLGSENLEDIEEYKGSYEDGVAIRVLAPHYYAAKSLLPPQNLPEPPDYPEGPVTCPVCKSDDVVLESAEGGSSRKAPEKFSWHCDACGHKWQDDGVEKEV